MRSRTVDRASSGNESMAGRRLKASALLVAFAVGSCTIDLTTRPAPGLRGEPCCGGPPPPPPQEVEAVAQIVSRPSHPDGYITGERIIIVVESEEAASAEGLPRIKIAIGDYDRFADFQPAPEDDWLPERPSRRWRFEYTVAGDDLDQDGISLSATALMYRATFLVDGSPVSVVITAVVSGDVSSDHVRAQPGENLFSHRITRPREPRVCTDERELATNFSAFAAEWDGIPFRVDMVRNFPDSVTEADVRDVFDVVGLLAERLEDQLGYPVIEPGDLIPVPAGTPQGWDRRPPVTWQTCPLSRDGGQVHLYYRFSVFRPDDVDIFVFGSPPRCGAIAVNRLPERYEVEFDALITRAFFRLFGFQPRPENSDSEQGVAMSDRLYLARRPGLESVRWSDIDALRCIFPEGR